jgi:hypothetical protein
VTGNAIVPSLDADFELCSAGIRLGDWMCDGIERLSASDELLCKSNVEMLKWDAMDQCVSALID